MTIELKEMERIVKDYHTYFPKWKILDGDILVRESGPILQGIVLYRPVDADTYTPTGFIRVLTAPKMAVVMEWPQRLEWPKGSECAVSPQEHEGVRAEIVEALRQQLTPAIDRPLVAVEVLKLYERKAMPTALEAYSLATLRAYLGYEQEARQWCARFKELAGKKGQRYEYEEELYFLKSLQQRLDEGTARKHLEEVLQAERCKLGLVSKDTASGCGPLILNVRLPRWIIPGG